MNFWDIAAIFSVVSSVLIFAGPMDWGRKQTGAFVVAAYFMFGIGVAIILA